MISLGLNNFHCPVAARLHQSFYAHSEYPLLFLETNTKFSDFPCFCYARYYFRYKIRIKIHSSVIILSHLASNSRTRNQ